MNDIERLLTTPADEFEKRLFFAERVLNQMEAQLSCVSRITSALDCIFDTVVAEAVDEGDTVKTPELVRKYRGLREYDPDEHLRWMFQELHAMHRLYRESKP